MILAASSAYSSSLLRSRSSSIILQLLRRSTATPAILRRPLLFTPPSTPSPNWTRICAKAYSAEAETSEKSGIAGEGVREFRRRIRIADVRGGPDQGLDWLGRTLSVRGWVRTCRVQSSVTFIEANP